MQEAEKRACILCRVGEYRKAAAIALRHRRTTLSPTGEFDLVLPTVLNKLGHYRASVLSALKLMLRSTSFRGDLIMIISSSVKSRTLKPSDIANAFDYIESIRLSPTEAAVIAAGFEDEAMQSLFLDEAKSRYRYAEEELNLISACISFRKEDFQTAMRLLQADQANGGLSSVSAKLAARILLNTGYLYPARRYACHLLKSNRQDVEALDILGQALNAESNWKAARKAYALIHEITGDDVSKLNMFFIMPQVACSVDELSEALESFIVGLDKFSTEKSAVSLMSSLALSTPICHTFFLAYQGSIDLRWLLDAYYRLIRSVAHQVIQENKSFHSPKDKASPHSPATRGATSRTRIGFTSRNLFQHSNLQAHAGLIQNLSRNLFEVVLIHRHGVKKDMAHLELNEHADRVIYLAADFGSSCKLIAELDLDINYITDIGMNPLDGVLPMVRLAHTQVTGWGLPHTTGLSEIDYYLRSKIFHDCEGQGEYSETLASIDGYLGYFDIDRSSLIEKSTDYFMLPPDRFLVGCLQTLHKIHPGFDSYLEEIARLDESILIIIAASESDALNQRFVQRIKRSAPTAHKQICFVQRMAISDYYSLNHLLDLNLDPIHYGAGITFIQTAWCGPPCITLRGNTLRSAVVSRSYEYAEIKDAPIAKSKSEYISLFEKLMRDDEHRLGIREEIHKKSVGAIYNNNASVTSCEEFLYRLAKAN